MRAFGSVLLEILRVQLWVIPGIAAVLAVIAALVVVWVDPGTGGGWIPIDIVPDSARAVLSAISGAMISFTALVFSITMLVLQQASSQLSPRVMRTFLRDRFSQSVLGLFVAAFVFSLLVLLDVTTERVSHLGLAGSVGLVLAAIMAFVAYIDHIAHAIRPISVIRSLGAETRDAIDRNYPEDDASGDDSDAGAAGDDGASPADAPIEADHERVVARARESGYVQAFDESALHDLAEQVGHDIRLSAGVGEFIVRGSPLVVVLRTPGAGHGGNDPDEGDDADDPDDTDQGAARAVRIGPERTMSQDPEFGFRQLVDVALRALSPSLNDPSTAIQVIDEMHDLLRHLQPRPIPSPRVIRRGSGPSVSIPAPDWEAFLRLAVAETARSGSAMPEVTGRLREMLVDLEGEGIPERLAAVRRTHVLIDEAVGSLVRA